MPSGSHATDKTYTTFIIVKETREISSGHNPRTGKDFTMWQIIATKPDGTMIDRNLRSFEDLPRGEVLEVSVTPFVSEQWGTSYTLARKNKSQLHSDVEGLQARIERIEKILGVTPEENSGAPPLPPTAPPALPGSTPDIAPPQLAGGQNQGPVDRDF